jgi:hypothetical protein
MARSVRSIASASKTDIGRFQQFGSLELAKTQLQARWILTDAVMQRRSTSPEFQNARAMKPARLRNLSCDPLRLRSPGHLGAEQAKTMVELQLKSIRHPRRARGA